MKERLEEARKRLAELEKIAEPTPAEAGSMAYLRECITHLEAMTTPER